MLESRQWVCVRHRQWPACGWGRSSPKKVGALSRASWAFWIAAWVLGAMFCGAQRGLALVQASARSPSSGVALAVGELSYPMLGGGGSNAVSGITVQS